jgi:hypothetical protein
LTPAHFASFFGSRNDNKVNIIGMKEIICAEMASSFEGRVSTVGQLTISKHKHDQQKKVHL